MGCASIRTSMQWHLPVMFCPMVGSLVNTANSGCFTVRACSVAHFDVVIKECKSKMSSGTMPVCATSMASSCGLEFLRKTFYMPASRMK